MEILEYRTWIIFYLISFTALLWAVFLSSQGVMLWASLCLNITVMGINGGLLLGEIKKYKERRQRIQNLLDTENEDFVQMNQCR